MTPEQAYEFTLLALCVWREARGETTDAKSGVAWTIRNRVLHPSWWGVDWVSVILKPFQFSSFNRIDVNSTKWPAPSDTAWHACMEAAEEAYSGSTADPTSGATHYFDKSLDSEPPGWATDDSMTHVCDLGNFHFYKAS